MSRMNRIWLAAGACLAPLIAASAHAQSGWVRSHQKISYAEGGFTGIRSEGDWFGWSVASLGDLDGDGVGDLAVGAPLEKDRRRAKRGAVWVLLLNENGTVKAHQKISAGEGGGPPDILEGSGFGLSVASLGDLDGDGVCDLAVGGFAADDEGISHGAVWVLFLNTDGTVKSHQKISDTEGGFTGILDDGDRFGVSAASLGDLDGDGVGDVAVGTMGDELGGTPRGAVWVLFLRTDGTVKSHQKISATEGGFTAELDHGAPFGMWMDSLGDLDDDGVGDLGVGEWVLFLRRNGTVKSHQKINDVARGFKGAFGRGLTSPGDLDGDGVADVVGWTMVNQDGGEKRATLCVQFRNSDGTAKRYEEMRDTTDMDSLDWSSVRSLASLGDVDGDGVGDLAVGGIDVNGHGAVWVLFLNTDGASQVAPEDP